MIIEDWIKMQKSLRQDPRVWRIARALRDRDSRHAPVTHVTFYITLVLGGLAALWMHGDTFADEENDTLSVTLAEINELTGIEGFAELLPRDWLEVLDSESVKLPRFQEHNGSVARTRALAAKRSARYRDRHRDSSVTKSVTRVTPSREQRRVEESRGESKNTHTPGAREASRNGVYTEEDSRAFNAIREIYPKFAGRQDWLNAEHHCTVLVEHGATWAQLRAGVERYAAYVTAGGASSPKYVLTPGKFFSGADRPWEQTWAVPEGTGANGVSQRRVTIAEYDELSRKRLAELPGEDPGPL